MSAIRVKYEGSVYEYSDSGVWYLISGKGFGGCGSSIPNVSVPMMFGTTLSRHAIENGINKSVFVRNNAEKEVEKVKKVKRATGVIRRKITGIKIF